MFNNIPNIINQDGVAIYYGNIMDDEQIGQFYNEILDKIPWENERVIMFGKEIVTKRKVAFYSDPHISYTYSSKTKNGLLWTASLLQMKQLIEAITQSTYNACLLNLYHNGLESMGWHSDDEKEIVTNSSIASLSLGATRKFSFKHKQTKEIISINLENGSLLEMKGSIQKNWWHTLPKTTKVLAPRINLTFRQMHISK
jgi:alkylated DNA repair dioxygenase AlkB